MENAQRKSSPKKRRISERVDWRNKDVIAVLRMMDGDKSITLSTGCDLIEGLTGRRVDTATMCRHLRLLRESCRGKLCSAPIGGGLLDDEKDQQASSSEANIDMLGNLLGHSERCHIDNLHNQPQGIEQLHKMASERTIESESEATSNGTTSTKNDAYSTLPSWSRVLASRSANEPTGLKEAVVNSCGNVQADTDRYDTSEGFCVKREADSDVAVMAMNPSYSSICSTSASRTLNSVDCGINKTDRVASLPSQSSYISSANCPRSSTLPILSSPNSTTNQSNSHSVVPAPHNVLHKTAPNGTIIRTKRTKNSMPNRCNAYNARRYNMLLKNARRIAAESSIAQQRFSMNGATVGNTETIYRRGCTNTSNLGSVLERSYKTNDSAEVIYERGCTTSGNNGEAIYMRGCTVNKNAETVCGRSPTSNGAIAPSCNGGTVSSSHAVNDEDTTSVVVCSSEKRKSVGRLRRELPIQEKRMEDALRTIEALLNKVGNSLRDEFNNLGDSVADCLRGVNRVDTTVAAQFKLELLEMMARYQKATLLKQK